MRALVIYPDRWPAFAEAPDDEEERYRWTKRTLGGGWLEAVQLTDDLHAYVDEEGKLKPLVYNAVASRLFAMLRGHDDAIMGVAVVFGTRHNGLDLADDDVPGRGPVIHYDPSKRMDQQEARWTMG